MILKGHMPLIVSLTITHFNVIFILKRGDRAIRVLSVFQSQGTGPFKLLLVMLSYRFPQNSIEKFLETIRIEVFLYKGPTDYCEC